MSLLPVKPTLLWIAATAWFPCGAWLLCGAWSPSATADEAGPTAEQRDFFETKIRPVLVERCLDCHNSEDPENGLDLSSRAGMIRGGKLGTALRPGRPEESLLISALRHDEFVKMPPKEKLPSHQVVDFTRWVRMGAPWPNSSTTSPPITEDSDRGSAVFSNEQKQHWSFQPVTDPDPPKTKATWSESPIDRFVLAQLEAAGLSPAPRADKRTLIRRATYDLTGLPPTPEDVEAFLNDDTPEAFSRVVDRLLQSPRYGEHWGRHWLDVARYADSNGLDENLSYANAFRYRDYVIRALNDDKPYARFVQEQIAGDLLPPPDNDQHDMDRYIATGFLAIGPKMLAEDDPVKMQMDIIDEQLSTLGQTFMGLTIGCARCHDHKFDPFPTDDYYALAGIFKSSRTMENHKVVAVWYERPLVSKKVSDRMADIDSQTTATSARIDAIRKAERERLKEQIQSRFANYLLASSAVDRLQQNSRSRTALTVNSSPFPIVDGFAFFEAEAFHRGNVQKVTAGYGEGIGITGTSGAGFLEFDVRVDTPGRYQLEIRHAAADSRPLKLLVNGKLVEAAVAGQVTGSWYPDGQKWYPAGQFDLQKGLNTIRLDSDKVHPHVDRLALVYHTDGEWPFPTSPENSLAGISRKFGVSPFIAMEWNDFLKQIADGKLEQFPSLVPWTKLAAMSTESPDEDEADLVSRWLNSDALSSSTPATTRQALAGADISSLKDVAAVYQRLLANEDTKTELTKMPCPLAGPAEITPSLLPDEKRKTLLSLQHKLTELQASRPEYDVAMGVTEGTPENLKIHLRGSHIALGRTVPRRFPRILSPQADGSDEHESNWEIPSDQSGRLQLAQWVTQPDHPLTWRVIVNRVWHWHFGRGLVPSVDNFGLLGQQPSHPQLLDWLARRFQESSGSLKELHRLMMLSQTYQMSTQFAEGAATEDPENRLLWRFRRRRLTGEEMRDSLIALGTGLDATMGGSVLKVKNRAYVTGSGTSITNEFENHRRSVYLPVVRSAVYDVLQTFDFPDPAVAAGRRQTSTVAPQALMLMNSSLVEEQTEALAKRLLKMPKTDRAAAAIRLVLQRNVTAKESAAAEDYVIQAAQTSALSELSPEEQELRTWQSFSRILISSNEFAYIE